ncbi:MAG TPA: hypothetical protein VGQ26_03985 [Streptosporangiaceae bacterium]|nr:hypothetical protein [Streptosporangiaceae bacterium]
MWAQVDRREGHRDAAVAVLDVDVDEGVTTHPEPGPRHGAARRRKHLR